MKGSLVLFAGTLAGLSVIATPALSQDSDRPFNPGQRQPTTPPGRGMDGMDNTFRQAASLLEGTWNVSVKSMAGGAGATDSEITGTSTRNWILNDKILVEDVRSGAASLSQPGRESMGGQSFQGHGMFGYDSKTNEFQHVWTDSADSKICFSAGRYDERSRTFTFNKVKSSSGLTQPGMTPPPRTTPPTTTPPGTTPPPTVPPTRPPTSPDDQMSFMQTSPTSPPAPPTSPPSTTPGGTQPARPAMPEKKGQLPNIDEVERIVIRILDDNRHVVEYFGGATGTQNKLMELTYTKSR